MGVTGQKRILGERQGCRGVFMWSQKEPEMLRRDSRGRLKDTEYV